MRFVSNRVDIITMGCSKNLVDSERLLKRIESLGFKAYHDSDNVCGKYVVINTCGFIGDAKQESIDMILRFSQAKKERRIGSLYVMGCLSERYREELQQEIPEVDAYFGKFDWVGIIDLIKNENRAIDTKVKLWDRTITTPPHTTYIKISEGCNRFCAYCAIPLITGRHKSRPISEIIDEVRDLAGRGVKEFNVIAQDLSAYGTDLYGKSKLAELIDTMADVAGVEWIRLHYAYPVDFPLDVLDVMKRRNNVCKYLDIALQHISTPILANMRRHIDREETLKLLSEIRRRVPEIRIRTTLMTGFPGEGEEEFKELMDFVVNFKFDRLGVFSYCEEDDTWAQKKLNDSIPQEIKDLRKNKILQLQEGISLKLNEQLVGTRVRIIIDRIEDKEMVGRTQWDSPEVDNEVRISFTSPEAPCKPGDMIDCEIVEADTYDLYGRLL